MSRLIMFAAILVLVGAGPVLAEDEGDDFARNGIYAGVTMAGAYYTEVEDDIKGALEALGYSGDVDTERPLGFGAQVGYRFHPHFAGEVRLRWFAKSESEFDGVFFAQPDNIDIGNLSSLDLETLNVTGNLKGYLLTGRIQPYVMAGGGLMHLKAKDKLGLGVISSGDAFAGHFGGGVDLYLNPHIVVVLEGSYVLPTGKLDGLKQAWWSFGLNYRF